MFYEHAKPKVIQRVLNVHRTRTAVV